MFGSDFFAGNRERLRQLFTGTAPIVVTANGLLQRAGDETFPFKQDGSFWYLIGVDHPDVILVMDKGREYLIVPQREAIMETFDGAIDIAELTRRSGIKEVLHEKEGWKQLETRVKKVQHVATLAANPAYIEHFGMYTNPARRRLIRRLKQLNPALELLDLRQHLGRMRMVKQPIELEALTRAIDITNESIRDVLRPKQLGKYAYEYEIEADLVRGFRRRGAQDQGFTPIVASGPHACTMHHISNDGPLASDELVLFDVGASFDHYCADMARTVSLNGRPSRRQQQVYDAVCAAQDYAYSLLKPNLELRVYEDLVENFIGEKLRELGLIKTITREAVRREFFPHRTSHFIGIDAHDAGDYDEPLKPNATLAVETGIYIRAEGIGIRVEYNVVITETGYEILGKPLSRLL
ncbi:MAG TPA: aminopeptidase P N-terminal domain-containing protein [Candidatus Saccharimonadales bacterium]|nr:aminopeptidase P N-terminal domain-containing protein [Candidatus Saccharimonadales bacterium]